VDLLMGHPMNDLNDYKEALGASYSQANAYCNIVIGAGYAGFFAL
jgi:hypothetical protein